MDFRKIALYAATLMVGFMLWTTWLHDNPPQATRSAASTQGNTTASGNYVPQSYAPQHASATAAHVQAQQSASVARGGNVITVKTDLMKVSINLKGGNVVGTQLLQYPVSVEQKNTPMSILSAGPVPYIAQSGITHAGNQPIVFSASKSQYRLADNQNSLTVTLMGKQAGLQVKKIYTFTRGRYTIGLQQRLMNTGKAAWSGSFYQQFFRQHRAESHWMSNRGYNGGAISTPDKPYDKLTYKNMNESNLGRSIPGGWVAMQQHYFLSTWLPAKNSRNYFYSRASGADNGANNYTLGYVSPAVNLKQGQQASQNATLYVGPEIQSRLDRLDPHLHLTVNYGFLSFFAEIIFWLMKGIHHFVGNWGWSIILVTVIIKLLLYYPSAMSYKSMARMRDMAPRMKALQERYADDRQALSKATMELYKREKVNPMGGCLPMLVQLPIFIAFYSLLVETVQLRQAPFIFWIHDLTVHDPYYILPVLMGASMFLQQKLSPPPPDPAQAKMMMFLPVIFTVFFLHFPVGLVIYYLTNNLLSVAQQWYVMKTFDPKADEMARRNKSKQAKRGRRRTT